jgi:hypothetical protein
MKNNYLKPVNIKLIVVSIGVLLQIILCVIITLGQGAWSAVGSGINAQALAMTEYNTELYIGKLNFSIPDEINRWDGTNLLSVGGGTNGPVGAFVIFNSELYVGGGFTVAGGHAVADVAKWNGTNWIALGSQLDNFAINALAIYNGELYAAGYSFNATGAAPSLFTIAKWNGSAWEGVGAGLQGGDVYALAVYNNELYASGTFTNSGSTTVGHIAKWNGSSWSAVGAGTNSGTTVYTLSVYQNELYAGGNFSTAGGISASCLAKWNGSAWSKVGTTSNGTNNTVIALTTYNTELYVGGAFSTAGGISANHIAKWNGSTWSALGNGVGVSGNTNEQVWCIAPYNNSIYAAGTFTQASGITVSNIARWTEATSVNENFIDRNDIHIYPNPVADNSIIEFSLNKKSLITINIYDLIGHKISSLVNDDLEPGKHQVSVLKNGALSPGIYFVRFTSSKENFTIKIMAE